MFTYEAVKTVNSYASLLHTKEMLKHVSHWNPNSNLFIVIEVNKYNTPLYKKLTICMLFGQENN